MIRFNIPPVVGKEYDYIKNVIDKNSRLCGDGEYTKKCNAWMESRFV